MNQKKKIDAKYIDYGYGGDSSVNERKLMTLNELESFEKSCAHAIKHKKKTFIDKI